MQGQQRQDGKLVSLWRYPVKSLLGEQVTELELDARGAVGDRRYAIATQAGKFGSGKNTRRFRKMDGLFALAGQSTAAGIGIRFPDGTLVPHTHPELNLKLSAHLERPVRLVYEASISHFDAGAIHVLSLGALAKLQALLPEAQIDVRRFRPNLVLDLEQDLSDADLVGATLRVGEVELQLTQKTQRCAMVTQAQSELPSQPAILKMLHRNFDLELGLYARVLTLGKVKLGDRVAIEPRRQTS